MRLPSVVLFSDTLYTQSASDQHRQLRAWLPGVSMTALMKAVMQSFSTKSVN
ncbi:MAG: hypothetical protein ACI8PW_001053 [Methylophilaceae bacterium]|jgi:hypothetical protein